MTPSNGKPAITVAPIALRREEAAASLGLGLTTFKQRVAPELPVIRVGGVKVYPVDGLRRWAEQNAERPMAEQVGGGS